MAVLAVVIPILVVAAAILLVASYRRRDTRAATGHLSRETRSRDTHEVVDVGPEPIDALSGREVERAAVIARRESETGVVKAEPAVPAEWTPPDPEAVGVSRRQFFNRSIVAFFGLGLTGFGAAVLAFLWPPFVTGFGADFNLGDIDDLKAQIRENNGFLYRPEARAWITEYPFEALEKARAVYSATELVSMEAGLVALYQKCPHLGCRVPQCVPSQYFECPCHGSRYNRVGEKRGGPAPRGMDRFGTSISNNELTVQTSVIVQGPAIGINTTGQEPEGPSCLGETSH